MSNTMNMSPFILLVSLFVIFLASFGDEVASVSFAFSKVDTESMFGVSTLMSMALAGAFTAGPISIFLLKTLRPSSILMLIFLSAALAVVLGANFVEGDLVYAISFILGCLGNIFWSVLSSVIPNQVAKESLTNVNKIVQSVRNSGYILGPTLAGLLCSSVGVRVSLIIVGTVFFFAGLLSKSIFYDKSVEPSNTRDSEKLAFLPDLPAFFRLSGMRMTVFPLIVTICTTSTFNVAFIHLMLADMGYSTVTYGYVTSAISIGLVMGPVLFASRIERLGASVGSCLCGAIIGSALILVSLNQSVFWMFSVLLLLGLANGVQNTLMATYVMKSVPKDRCNVLMPTYIFVVQSSVLVGFLIGGQVPVEYARSLLSISGGIALLAGFVGVVGNYYADTDSKPLVVLGGQKDGAE